jgi:hypothetical protein
MGIDSRDSWGSAQSPVVLVILQKRRDAGGRVPPLSVQASANILKGLL